MHFSSPAVHRKELFYLLISAVCWIGFAWQPTAITLVLAFVGNVPFGSILWKRYQKEEATDNKTNMEKPPAPETNLDPPPADDLMPLAERTVLLRSPDVTVALSAVRSVNVTARIEVKVEGGDRCETISVGDEPVRFGRESSGGQVVIAIPAVSRQHLEIIREADLFYAIDLGSTNGTFLNEQSMTPMERYPLKDGDALRLPGLEAKFHIEA
jgi:hypothetical protein